MIPTDFGTIEEKVMYLLEHYPMLRSSDRMLIAAYMKQVHGITTFKEYAYAKKVPSVESIRRVRQKIQERGLYPANQETETMRDKCFADYRNYARGE